MVDSLNPDSRYTIEGDPTEEDMGHCMKGSKVFVKDGQRFCVSQSQTQTRDNLFVHLTCDTKNTDRLNSIQLTQMVSSGSCSFWFYVKLLFYGNWCGAGRSGPEEPVDVIDKCCQEHDLCWDPYVSTYDWEGRAADFSLVCFDSSDTGEGKVCRCDLKFANCLENLHLCM